MRTNCFFALDYLIAPSDLQGSERSSRRIWRTFVSCEFVARVGLLICWLIWVQCSFADVATPNAESDSGISVDIESISRPREVLIGNLVVGKTNVFVIDLRNTTTSTLSIKGIKSGCGCVKASSDCHNAKPGSDFHIRLEISPFVQADRFQQELEIEFDEPPHRLQIRLKGTVEGEVKASPTHLAFATSGESKTISVTSVNEGVKLLQCQMVRGVIKVEKAVQESPSHIELTVRSNVDSGQAIGMLRVRYEKSGGLFSSDIPIALAAKSNVRFLPSSLTLVDNRPSHPVKVLFTGRDVPEGLDELLFFFSGADGKQLDECEVDLSVKKHSERLYEVGFASIEGAREITDLVLRFRDRSFFCPVVFGD